jgi:hypothetical protein
LKNNVTAFNSLILGLFFLGACASKPTLYSWGQYENTVYSSYADPGKVPVEKQIEQLEKDYQRARSENKPVPPGWHAHLGYLYFQIGKLDQAKSQFETEKKTFPESTVLMNRLLAKFEKS